MAKKPSQQEQSWEGVATKPKIKKPSLYKVVMLNDDFTPMDWAYLAAHNKDFINIAPLHEFSGAEWYIVLNRQPLLIEHCPVIDDLPPNYWDALLKEYPWFETYRKKQKKHL